MYAIIFAAYPVLQKYMLNLLGKTYKVTSNTNILVFTDV